jgi:hypothetical protein
LKLVEPVQERLQVAELLRLLDENPDLLEALQERIVDEKAILRALEKRAETREAIRRLVLRDDFLQLPDLVRQLIEAQLRNEAQLQEHFNRLIRQLIESQQRHEAILQENARQLRELTAQVQRVVGASGRARADGARLCTTSRSGKKGFDGLRRGAELEKEVRQRARTIFAGGRGGHPESPFVSKTPEKLAAHAQRGRPYPRSGSRPQRCRPHLGEGEQGHRRRSVCESRP